MRLGPLTFGVRLPHSAYFRGVLLHSRDFTQIHLSTELICNFFPETWQVKSLHRFLS